MKKSHKAIKYASISVCVFLALQLIYPLIMHLILGAPLNTRYASSIGIIGGADGPTSIFIANGSSAKYYWMALSGIVTAIIAIMLWRKGKRP